MLMPHIHADSYGHCGFLVDDVTEFSKSLMAQGVEFKKKPWEGNMKTIAFAYDPDVCPMTICNISAG